MRHLLQHNAVVNATDKGNRTPLHWAVRYKGPEGIKVLLQTSGIDVYIKDKLHKETPFQLLKRTVSTLAEALQGEFIITERQQLTGEEGKVEENDSKESNNRSPKQKMHIV